jgi:cell division protein FtsB
MAAQGRQAGRLPGQDWPPTKYQEKKRLPSPVASWFTPSSMNVDLGIWDRLTRLIVLLLLLAALLGIAVWYFPLIQQNERMRKEILSLDNEIKQEEASYKHLRASIEAMHDPKTIERLARERLNYAKAGETIVRFEAPATNGAIGRTPGR